MRRGRRWWGMRRISGDGLELLCREGAGVLLVIYLSRGARLSGKRSKGSSWLSGMDLCFPVPLKQVNSTQHTTGSFGLARILRYTK